MLQLLLCVGGPLQAYCAKAAGVTLLLYRHTSALQHQWQQACCLGIDSSNSSWLLIVNGVRGGCLSEEVAE
jgi:hypothetical protein